MTKRIPPFVWVGFILCVVLVFSDAKGCSSIGGKATAATYVYEKDEGGIPDPVMSALNKLNRERPGFIGSPFEDDTLDGSGETPEQYKVPLAAAKESGVPVLVVTAKDKVLKVVKAPKTEEEVLQAVP